MARKSYRVGVEAKVIVEKRVVATSQEEAGKIAQRRVAAQLERLCRTDQWRRSFVDYAEGDVVSCVLTGHRV